MSLKKFLPIALGGILIFTSLSFPAFADDTAADNKGISKFRQEGSLLDGEKNQPDFIFSGDGTSVKVGKTLQYALTTDDEKYKNAAKWISSDISAATINKNGLITGIAPGKATIYGYMKFGDEFDGKVGWYSRELTVKGDEPEIYPSVNTRAVKAVKDSLADHVEKFDVFRYYYRVMSSDEDFTNVNVYGNGAVSISFDNGGKLTNPLFTLKVSKEDYSVSLIYDKKHVFNLTHD